VVETVATLRSEGSGALGAFLRKEGLYYATVRAWERLHASGALTAAKQGPKEKSRQALLTEIQRLRRKNEQLEKKLAKTELIVELQKKLSAMLSLDTEENGGTSDAR
jgi:cell shape-determining protein MreC